MKLTKNKMCSIAIFLLIYYIYMNSLRRIMIPISTISIPAILMFLLAVCLYNSHYKIRTFNAIDQLQCFSWIAICIYILINNDSLIRNLIDGGMIQLYVMVCVMLFLIDKDTWLKTWMKWTKIFVMIHAVFTIIFYFNSSLYSTYINLFFSPTTISECLRYYSRGWMCGLSSHFSTNGMILAIGIVIIFENLLYDKKVKSRKNVLYDLVSLSLLVYALILSSKRSPIVAVFLGVVFTYIVSAGKNVTKRLIIVSVISMSIFGLYIYLQSIIPGLSTILDKTESLTGTSAGIFNGREGLWRLALSMFDSNPIFGGGYGSYLSVSTAADAITTSAHNYYLQILAELGIIGLMLYCAAFISALVSTYKEMSILNKENGDKYDKMLLCISMDIQLFVIIYSITSTSLMYYPVMIPFFIACTIPRVVAFKRRRIQV